MRRRLAADLLPPALALAAGTLFFHLADADLRWTRPYCQGGEWADGNAGLWRALYRFGTFPAIAATAAAVIALIAGFRDAGWARFRRHALFLVLLMALGPGLIANAILKDHWGRPRPRDVAELGGVFPFEPVLAIDPVSPGKSFPCGHATMGFFFVAGYYLLRGRNRPAALGCMAAGLAGGTAIGWARVAQGGHFPSDVLWAGGITWMVAALLADLLRVEEVPPRPDGFRPVGWGKLAGVVLLLPALLFLALLSVPIETSETRELPGETPADISLRLVAARVRIHPGDATRLRAETRGFGLPGSGVRSSWEIEERPGRPDRARFRQRLSGLAAELVQEVELSYRPDRIGRVEIELPEGRVELRLPDTPAASRRSWEIEIAEGDVRLLRGPGPLDVKKDGRAELDEPGESDRVELKLGPGARWEIGGGK